MNFESYNMNIMKKIIYQDGHSKSKNKDVDLK